MGSSRNEDRCAILSDILGDEDHLGDMDFKVRHDKGMTALQMDIKVEGITPEIMKRRWSRRATAGCTSSARSRRR